MLPPAEPYPDEEASEVTVDFTTAAYFLQLCRESVADDTLPTDQVILNTKLPGLKWRELEHVRELATEFLQRSIDPDEICDSTLEDFSIRFAEALSRLGYPFISRRSCIEDLKKCEVNNNGTPQRNLLMGIVKQQWAGEIFDWNAESRWSQPLATWLLCKLPNPGVSFSFTLRSFVQSADESDPIPPDLVGCLSPDGEGRCFPFLFFEVVKTTIESARLANLRSAGQALSNIRRWMTLSQQEDDFFDRVRVFSFVFQDQALEIRMHRAIKLSNGSGDLSFPFTVVRSISNYEMYEAYSLVRSILEYASKKLHPILRATFTAISAAEEERIQKLRGRAAISLGATRLGRYS